MAKCSACKKEIDWLETTAGKRTPVDAGVYVAVRPERGGKTTIITDDGETIRGHRLGVVCAQAPLESWVQVGARAGRVPHFATCPEADRFRRRAR